MVRNNKQNNIETQNTQNKKAKHAKQENTWVEWR
jgi:hypothetical protein